MFRLSNSRRKKILDKIKIQYDKDVSPEQIQNLYMTVGWQYREIQDIISSIDKSVLVVTAWDDDVLIGIARATGDGIYNATIWDVAVRPDYQKQGVGTLIIKSMLTKLDACGIPLITLYTMWAKKDFYSKLGFESDFDKVIGMYRYKK